MRVAWFTHRYSPCVGGAENFGRAIVQRFVAAGHSVDVVTSDAHDLWYFVDRRRGRVDAPAENWVDGARVRRFAVRHFPAKRYVGRLLSYLPHWPTQCRWDSYMPLIPGIEKVRGDYDAVFGVGFPFTVFSYAALKTARASGAPLLLTPFLHLATPGDPVNRTYTRPHQIRLLREADTVVVQTELEAAQVVEWGIPRARVLVLGMGVDHDLVTGGDRTHWRSQLAIGPNCPVIGHLATLDPNKGTHDLVRAVERLNDQRAADRLIHLLLAGPSSPDFESFRAALAPATSRWLHVLGPMKPEGRPDFYAALDVFAMPSRTDSFGIVFLEAWTNGLPVVAAAAGGVSEVVSHEQTGLLVPFGDVSQLAGALDRLLADRSFAQRLGSAGRARVARGHTWDDRYAALEGRARALIAERAGSRPSASGPKLVSVNSRIVESAR